MKHSDVSGCQVAALEERLKELEGERAELVKFQQVDKQRRSLEYTIYDTEITDARQALEQARSRPRPACWGLSGLAGASWQMMRTCVGTL